MAARRSTITSKSVVEPQADAARKTPATEELGVTGLTAYSGWIREEFLTDLTGNKARKIYREMADNDPTVGAVLFAVEMICRSVEWDVETAGDTADDEEARKFVQGLLGDMDDTWQDFIAEALTMLTYGYSAFEIVLKRRDGPDQRDPARASKFTDGAIGVRRLAPRSQESFTRWHFAPNDDLLGFVQTDIDRSEIYIPAERMLLFRTTSRKGNPEGRSILRNAYRPWLFKKRIEEIEGIGVERDLAGLPVIEAPMQLMRSDASASDKAMFEALKGILANVRQDRGAGVIIPSDAYKNADGTPGSLPMFKLSLLSTAGSRQFPTSEIINRYDRRIAATALADFVMLGQEAVGSYALSKDKTALFAAALQGILGNMAEVMNRKLLPYVWRLNGWDHATMPRLKPARVLPEDMAQTADYLSKLAAAGMAIFPNPDLERHLMLSARLPEPPEEGMGPLTPDDMADPAAIDDQEAFDAG